MCLVIIILQLSIFILHISKAKKPPNKTGLNKVKVGGWGGPSGYKKNEV